MTDHPTNDESMNEQQIREALTGLADAPGVPDEANGWDRVRGGVEHDRRFRRSALVGLSSVAAAAAAVVGVLVLTDDDGRQTVEVGPIDTPTTVEDRPSTTDSTPTSSVPTSPPPGFPAHPLAVVVSEDGIGRLDLYDAGTGAVVTRGLARSPHSVSQVSFGPDGTVYFTEEFGDSSTVRAVPWDGSAEPVTPFDAGNETSSGALSPDGRTFAYVHQGVTTDGGEIVLVDTATGDRRVIRWAPDDEDFFHTNGSIDGLEWSPAGERLLFVSSYEGSEPLVLDATAASLSEAAPVTDLSAFDVHWSGADELIGLHLCCFPEYFEPEELRRVSLSGGGTTNLETGLGAPSVFDVDGNGRIAIVREDGSVALIDRDGTITEIDLDLPALDVGF